jgi:hypothetical protein
VREVSRSAQPKLEYSAGWMWLRLGAHIRRLWSLCAIDGQPHAAPSHLSACRLRCGKPASKRCARCGIEWYCGRDCQVGST